MADGQRPPGSDVPAAEAAGSKSRRPLLLLVHGRPGGTPNARGALCSAMGYTTPEGVASFFRILAMIRCLCCHTSFMRPRFHECSEVRIQLTGGSLRDVN